MITFSAPAESLILLDDPKVPALGGTEYILNVAAREYGQITVILETGYMTPAQLQALEIAELGYSLNALLSVTTLNGNFDRYRKTPSSRSTLVMRVTALIV